MGRRRFSGRKSILNEIPLPRNLETLKSLALVDTSRINHSLISLSVNDEHVSVLGITYTKCVGHFPF